MVMLDISLLVITVGVVIAAIALQRENEGLKSRLERRELVHDLLLRKYFKLDAPKSSNIGVEPLTAQDIAKKSQERHTKPVNLRKSWVQEQAELEAKHDTKGRMHQILVQDIENLQGPLPTKE